MGRVHSGGSFGRRKLSFLLSIQGVWLAKLAPLLCSRGGVAAD